MVDRIQVICRHGTYPGIRLGRVCAYDFTIPERYEVRGDDRLQRVFVLLDEHIQLQQPLSFPSPFEDWWYVDLVEVSEDGDVVHVTDHWLDVAVPPHGAPYRVMDGDELGEALADGLVSAEQVARGLVHFQHFLDRYLHGPPELGFDRPTHRWFDFPPACIEALTSLPI